ncbi:hypothetical protein HI914_00189 [Erysiphe necator]|nr:hypothetical protein HI914_00189 [Erysiphe necator]
MNGEEINFACMTDNMRKFLGWMFLEQYAGIEKRQCLFWQEWQSIISSSYYKIIAPLIYSIVSIEPWNSAIIGSIFELCGGLSPQSTSHSVVPTLDQLSTYGIARSTTIHHHFPILNGGIPGFHYELRIMMLRSPKIIFHKIIGSIRASYETAIHA